MENTDETKLRDELKKYGPVYNTQELQENFVVESFLAPFCIVTRKSDNVKGTLQFTHMPRFYYNFLAD